MPQEIESRYLAPDRATYRRLLRLYALGPYTLTPQGWQRVRDWYLDTADGALARQGWSCRLRREDGLRRSVTLKGPAEAEGPGTSRAEYEQVLDSMVTDPAEWPVGELRTLLMGLTGGAPLKRVARLRQRRYHLAVSEGQRFVARLSLDRLRVRGRVGQQEGYLVECELMGQGRTQDLLALDALLTDLSLVREARSKQRFSLDLVREAAKAGPTPMGLRPREGVTRAASRILAHHTRRMLANEPGVRQGVDPEAVHDMRVATRRLRSALGFFGPFLRDPRLVALAPRLQRLGRLLGRVRDLDVALERARAYEASHAEGGDLAPLLRVWERQRARHHRRLVRYLDTSAHARWMRRWQELLAQMAQADDREEPTVGQVAPLLVYLQWRAVWSFDRVLPQAPAELLHALRIGCKRLRYGLEFCAEVLPSRVVRLVPAITALQDHLGELNDHVTAIAMLQEAWEHVEADEARRGIEAYIAHSQEEQDRLIASFGGRWARFTRRNTRRAWSVLIR
jgi:triphosphatase